MAEVPVDNTMIGESAKSAQPYILQVFIGANPEIKDNLSFERKLYVIRKRAEKSINQCGLTEGESAYFASLSSRTIVYKGMLTPEQLDQFYLDLKDPTIEIALALVHSRFSTHTFPSWERALPLH